MFVVDGAYREFSDIFDDDISQLLKEENIVYLGTFSKAYGLSGFRVGYLMGESLYLLNIKEIPYVVSNISIIVATKELQSDFIKKNKDYINEEQERFLKNLPFLERKNHLLIFNTPNAQLLHKHLKSKKIHVRLINETIISFSVNKRELNDVLISEINKFIKE